MSASLWQLEQVSLAGSKRSRLEGLSWDVPPGVTAVLGWSGAGKTSLLNLLVRFEKPTNGRIRFPAAQQGRLPYYWVPVDGGLWPHLTVRQHLELVAKSAKPWLERFDLGSVAESYPGTLSMGERSRLALARGLATQPQTLVLDEPLSHVDAARLWTYWDQIQEVALSTGMSLVFASHQPEIVLRHAEHLLCLEEGRSLWQGTVQQLYHAPPSERLGWFLGPVNWFEPAAARTWLQRETSQPLAVRPEGLQIQPDPQGPFQIEKAQGTGNLAEVELASVHSPEVTRRLFCRGGNSPLTAGMRVVLGLSLWLVMLCQILLTSGCDEEGPPTIPVSACIPTYFPAEGAKLPAPRALTCGPDGSLYALDDVGRVLVFNAEGKLDRQWWMPEYSVGRPEGVWIMLDGRIVVADTHYNRCVYFDMAGKFLGSFGEFGEAPGQFIYPIAITQDSAGFLYVAENGGNDRIQKFTADGEFVMQFGRCGIEPGEFQRPSGVVWREGKLYVADAFNNRILRFADSGELEAVLADAQTAGLHYPYDIAEGPDGTLYVVEYGGACVTHLDLEGKFLGRYGQAGRAAGEFWTPWGIAVRQDGTIFVADTGNRRLVELKP